MFMLCAVNPMTILWSTIVLLVLALVFGLVLAFCGKKLAVKEDERIAKVRSKLSGANCGGCGYAGCDAFAKAVVEGKADVNLCNATSAENKKRSFPGKPGGKTERKVLNDAEMDCSDPGGGAGGGDRLRGG